MMETLVSTTKAFTMAIHPPASWSVREFSVQAYQAQDSSELHTQSTCTTYNRVTSSECTKAKRRMVHTPLYLCQLTLPSCCRRRRSLSPLRLKITRHTYSDTRYFSQRTTRSDCCFYHTTTTFQTPPRRPRIPS